MSGFESACTLYRSSRPASKARLSSLRTKPTSSALCPARASSAASSDFVQSPGVTWRATARSRWNGAGSALSTLATMR